MTTSIRPTHVLILSSPGRPLPKRLAPGYDVRAAALRESGVVVAWSPAAAARAVALAEAEGFEAVIARERAS